MRGGNKIIATLGQGYSPRSSQSLSQPLPLLLPLRFVPRPGLTLSPLATIAMGLCSESRLDPILFLTSLTSWHFGSISKRRAREKAEPSLALSFGPR